MRRAAALCLPAHRLADGRARQGHRDRDRLRKGDAVALDGKTLSPATLLAKLNDLGRDNGIGRLDLVENRFVGMKSRGVYETPGGTILLAAHRAIESITLDRGAAHLKDELMPRYAELIYNGFWFAPEREMLQALIDKSQEHVEGTVRLKLYKGNVIVTGRESAEVALLRPRSSPSRTTRAPTTRRTPRASSGSTRCGCARSPAATKAGDLSSRCSRAWSSAASPASQIYLDMMFVLVLLIFTYPYFTAGSTQADVGWLHHRHRPAAFDPAARARPRLRRPPVSGARVSHIELTGLGGVAHFERTLPRSRSRARSSIWPGRRSTCALARAGWLAGAAAASGNPMLALPLAVLASAISS